MEVPTFTPHIAVTIGRQMRLYHAFVTTAPAALDAPATLTLHAAPLSDVSGMAADPIALDAIRARTPARLVLIDATELAWQRARPVRQGPEVEDQRGSAHGGQPDGLDREADRREEEVRDASGGVG